VNDIRLHREIPRNIRTVIVAFFGWSDAGDAATGAVDFLGKSRNAEPVAEIEPEEFFNFAEFRPIVNVDDSGVRSLTWPQNQFYLAPGTDATEPLLLFSGIEPHLRWQRFSDQFIDFLLECGVEHLISFGALLNAVPHTRKPFVNGSSGTPEIKATMQRLGISRGGSYNGPTGISSVIAETGQRRGISYSSFWGHVPHYIQTSPNPTIIHAILDTLRQSMGIGADLRELEGESASFYEQCEEAIEQEPSMRQYVRKLEQYYDETEQERESGRPSSTGIITPPPGTTPDFPDPQDLVDDLEEFLRRRPPFNGSSS
jgi:hypothetical protein